MNSEQFQSSLKNKITLVDFNAPWCAPCRAQAPIIEDLAEVYKNQASIIEIDIDQEKTLAARYMVQSIPTLIIFDDGREVKRFIGLHSRGDITQSLNNALGNAA